MNPINKVLLVATLAWVSVAVTFSAAPEQQSPDASAHAPREYRELLDSYCATCHNELLNLPAGAPLYLDTANLDNPAADAAVWEKVIRKLGVGAMPPRDVPSPGDAALLKFRSWLAARLDRAAAARINPGSQVLHRLNRAEYGNAIRDLLALNVDVTQLLPSDGGNFGFDNVATALTPSPMLLERYLTAALHISDLAVGDAQVPPAVVVHSIGVEVTQNDYVEGLPLGTRGGALVRHIFPADGEYVFSGRLLGTVAEGYAGVEGHEAPHQFVITLDGEQVHGAPVGGAEDHNVSAGNITLSKPSIDQRMTSPRVVVTAGAHEVGFTWVERPALDQAVWQPSLRASQGGHDPSGLPRLRTLNIEGPYRVRKTSDSPSRQRLLVCRPTSAAQELPCANDILSTLARRAFRRPVTQADLDAPSGLYNEARQNGGDFDGGLRAGVAGILSSPSFLFRAEHDPVDLPLGAAHAVSELELASRLSFFLWSSIPDDELLQLAIAGRLRAPGVLDAQVRRMIADRRADAMVSNFTGQWLQLRNLESLVVPNLTQFPDFDDNLRQAFRRETELLFASVLRESRSTLDLLNADYTFVNERLAKHYGIPGVYGSRFRRTPVADAYRRGLLGNGSILAVTSTANRTSPVFRGVYVLKNFFNMPPEPPPPNIPQLEASARHDRPTTVRQQLESHRANPSCASCHRSIDPIGFALENFDVVGQWRGTTTEGLKVDASGVLVDGTAVNGPVELRQALLGRPDVFVGAVTEKLMVYALGRGLETYDMPTVRSILRQAATDNYRFTSIVLGIVNSPPFQMRTKLAHAGSPDVAQTSTRPE